MVAREFRIDIGGHTKAPVRRHLCREEGSMGEFDNTVEILVGIKPALHPLLSCVLTCVLVINGYGLPFHVSLTECRNLKSCIRTGPAEDRICASSMASIIFVRKSLQAPIKAPLSN